MMPHDAVDLDGWLVDQRVALAGREHLRQRRTDRVLRLAAWYALAAVALIAIAAGHL